MKVLWSSVCRLQIEHERYLLKNMVFTISIGFTERNKNITYMYCNNCIRLQLLNTNRFCLLFLCIILLIQLNILSIIFKHTWHHHKFINVLKLSALFSVTKCKFKCNNRKIAIYFFYVFYKTRQQLNWIFILVFNIKNKVLPNFIYNINTFKKARGIWLTYIFFIIFKY